MPHTCAACGRTGERLLACGGRHALRYCDKACQKRHWKLEHKTVCGKNENWSRAYHLVTSEPALSSITLPNVADILEMPPEFQSLEIQRRFYVMSQEQFCNLTAALMVALEPKLVAYSMALATTFYLDERGDTYFLHEITTDFDHACLHVLAESAPMLAYPLAILKGRLSLFEFAIQLCSLNWSEEATPKYLEVLSVAIAYTKRVGPDSGGPGWRRDSLLVKVVGRADPNDPKVICKLTPLQFAVWHGYERSGASIRPAVVKALLDTGAYTWGDERRCSLTESPVLMLSDAVRIACAETVRHLLEAGFDATVRGAEDQSLLHVLSEYEAPDCAEKVQLLVAAGVSLEALDAHGFTPLKLAVCGPGSHSTFDALLAAGADPRSLKSGSEDDRSESCLCAALGKGDMGFVRRLLDTSKVPRGIISLTERYRYVGLTVLEHAALINDAKAVEALLAAGANHSTPQRCLIKCLNLKKATPLDLAICAGSYQACKALVLAGAPSHAGQGGVAQWVSKRVAAFERAGVAGSSVLVELIAELSGKAAVPPRTHQQIQDGMQKILAHLQRVE